jgi:hypothetical protein
MTIQEAKETFGNSMGYVSCMNCPLHGKSECPKNCNGFDDAWVAIARYMVKDDEFEACEDCICDEREPWEEPCKSCKHGIPYDDPRYEKAASLYIPKGTEKTEEPIKPKEDVVNHPSHYTTGGMECIDEMILVFGEAIVADFCLCNVWKYRKRALHKNGQEDLDKADWYMKKYKELAIGMEKEKYVREH